MNNGFSKLTAALSRPFTYGIICLLFGALFGSGFFGTPEWIIDIVMAATGGIIIVFALVQLLVALFGEGRGLTFFFAVIKVLVLLSFGILFIIFRSGLAHAVCVVVGIYLVLRSGWRLFVITRLSSRKNHGKFIFSVIFHVLAILVGLWMAIYPWPSDFLIGGAVLVIKGIELIVTDFPVKPTRKDGSDGDGGEGESPDGYVITDYKDITHD